MNIYHKKINLALRKALKSSGDNENFTIFIRVKKDMDDSACSYLNSINAVGNYHKASYLACLSKESIDKLIKNQWVLAVILIK